MPQRSRTLLALALALTTGFTPLAAQNRPRRALAATDIDDIATLLRLEDARTFDEAELKRLAASTHPEVRRRAVQSIGRIADKRGLALLDAVRKDTDAEVAATAAWSAGQLRDPGAIAWLAESLSTPRTPPVVAREAAIALGKIQPVRNAIMPPAEGTPDARAALATYLSTAAITKKPAAAIGEALLSIGRFPAAGDLAPILRWTSSPDVETRWRATWALFRSRAPEAIPELLRLSRDPSAEVRSWAVRGLIPHPNVDPAPAATRLRELTTDPDRAVRTEALRTLGAHDDDASVKMLLNALDAKDSWLSFSAAEVLARHQARADTVIPRLVAAAAPDRPLALRLRARQSLGSFGAPAAAALAALSTEGLPPSGGGGGGRGQRPQPQLRTLEEYRAIVEKWIVPDYKGAAKPRAILETRHGAIELELYPGDAPLGLEFFIRVTESGEMVGTDFSRVVPHFVAQQRGIRNDVVLRDEVSRRGLTRGNLSWASAGLDTGRPGYTLGVTPQPHNEGNFTALGRVIRGMDVVERIEQGDTITAARMVR